MLSAYPLEDQHRHGQMLQRGKFQELAGGECVLSAENEMVGVFFWEPWSSFKTVEKAVGSYAHGRASCAVATTADTSVVLATHAPSPVAAEGGSTIATVLHSEVKPESFTIGTDSPQAVLVLRNSVGFVVGELQAREGGA